MGLGWRSLSRRSRRVSVVVLVALVLVSACSSSATTPSPVPAPPPGTKWVGVGRTVFAVPAGWQVWPDLLCGSPDGRSYVTIRQKGVTAGCHPLDPGIRYGDVVELVVDRSGTVTWDNADSVRGRRASLPAGWLAVPRGVWSRSVGTSPVHQEEHALRSAGFHIRFARVPAWGSTGPTITTDPEIGTPARVGSTVVLQQHVAALADSGLSGRLVWVGGPSPGAPRPHPGLVHVTGNGFNDYVAADLHGFWHMALPAGAYTVAATSPGYGSRRGGPDACRAVGRPAVTAHEFSTVTVACQLK